MGAPYSPKAIANAFLQRSFNDKKVMGHMKLQKLVFLAHGYFLASTGGTPLINEPFEAWDYGPVCRSLYQEFRQFGGQPINRLATELNWDSDTEVPVAVPADDESAKKVIEFVYGAYNASDPFALSDLTHKSGWAWDKTREADPFKLRNKDIQNDLIEKDFKPFVKRKENG
ncbi:MAG: Panacea domain-containing protein [Alphaproteobacteria bacterium]